jgi:hypothetical protein
VQLADVLQREMQRDILLNKELFLVGLTELKNYQVGEFFELGKADFRLVK